MPDNAHWWSGSNADGTLSTNCGGWDENDGASTGTCEFKAASDLGWISAGSANSDVEYYIPGIAY